MVQFVGGKQHQGEAKQEKRPPLFIRNIAQLGVFLLHYGAQNTPVDRAAQHKQYNCQRHGRVQHGGKEVELGVFNPAGLNAHDLVHYAHAHNQIASSRKIGQLGCPYGNAGAKHNGCGFAAFGLEIEGIAQAHRHGAKNCRLAHDGRHKGRNNGGPKGNACKRPGKTAAREFDARQRNVFAKAGDLNDLA